MDMEERENGETIRQLNHRFKIMKEQKEKLKKKSDKTIADLEMQVGREINIFWCPNIV
jgi:hypothetical protein